MLDIEKLLEKSDGKELTDSDILRNIAYKNFGYLTDEYKNLTRIAAKLEKKDENATNRI